MTTTEAEAAFKLYEALQAFEWLNVGLNIFGRCVDIIVVVIGVLLYGRVAVLTQELIWLKRAIRGEKEGNDDADKRARPDRA